jgi:hypothetical protein
VPPLASRRVRRARRSAQWMARDPAPTDGMPRGRAEQLVAGVWETDRRRAFRGVGAGWLRRRRAGGGAATAGANVVVLRSRAPLPCIGYEQ